MHSSTVLSLNASLILQIVSLLRDLICIRDEDFVESILVRVQPENLN